jgi:hypothetical protein
MVRGGAARGIQQPVICTPRHGEPRPASCTQPEWMDAHWRQAPASQLLLPAKHSAQVCCNALSAAQIHTHAVHAWKLSTPHARGEPCAPALRQWGMHASTVSVQAVVSTPAAVLGPPAAMAPPAAALLHALLHACACMLSTHPHAHVLLECCAPAPRSMHVPMAVHHPAAQPAGSRAGAT